MLMKNLFITLFVLLSTTGQIQAETSTAPKNITASSENKPLNSAQAVDFSEAKLAQILAPIALYPDTLLTHILLASTYPLDIIKANRWLANHQALSAKSLKKALVNELENNLWDASVQILMSFPRVLKHLHDDLDWMQQLGDAFLSNEAQVLVIIQQLRQQAEQAGSLSKMTNSTVSHEGANIVIEPRQVQVIYVPYYDTRQVYGQWHWQRYPPVHWSVPKHFYNAGHSSGHSVHDKSFFWHSAVHISHRLFFGAFHWHKRHVVVIKNHHQRHNGHYKNNTYQRDGVHDNRNKIVTSIGAKRWQHNPQHRRNKSYSVKHVNKHVNKNINKQANKQVTSKVSNYSTQKKTFTPVAQRRVKKVHLTKTKTKTKTRVHSKQEKVTQMSIKKSQKRHHRQGAQQNKVRRAGTKLSIKKSNPAKRPRFSKTSNKERIN